MSAIDVERIRSSLQCDRPGCACHRRTGNLHCPAHDDPRPSLSVTEQDGRVLVCCHAGCDQDRVLETLKTRDLWPPTTEKIGQNGHGRKMPAPLGPAPDTRRGHVIAIYSYHAEDGALLSQAVRYEPKRFSQRRPDGAGGWIWNLNGTRRVLYRLPELNAADRERAIFVCEGEKDADRLASLGLIATTCAQGAGKWRDEYSQSLADRHVAILPDNDEPGRKHAEQVATSVAPVARSVRVITLPDLPEKGDVSDWLDAGGTVDQLRALWTQAAAWQPSEAHAEPITPDGPQLLVTSLADVTATPVNWIWERWLASGKVHIIGGHPGDGKSTLTAAIAAILSKGMTWPDGSPAPQGRTLFLLAEDALDDTLRPRLDALGADPALIFAIDAVKEPDGHDRLFSIERHLSLLEETIIARGIDLLVIDPITSFMPKADRNAEGDVRDLLTPLGKMAERTGVAIVAVMHMGKPSGTNRRPLQQLLGATAFGAVARVVWLVAEVPEGEDASRRVLGVVKSNIAMRPTALEWSRTQDGPIDWHGESFHDIGDLLSGVKEQPKEDAKGFLTEQLAGGSVSAKAILARASEVGISEKTLRRAAKDLDVERFKQDGVRDGGWFWKLPNGKMATPEPTGHLPATGKMATPEHGQVAIFPNSQSKSSVRVENPHESGKMATIASTGHLPQHDDEREDGQVAILSGGHLPQDTLTDTDSTDAPHGIYVCAGCTIPRSRDDAPCPTCGATGGYER